MAKNIGATTTTTTNNNNNNKRSKCGAVSLTICLTALRSADAFHHTIERPAFQPFRSFRSVAAGRSHLVPTSACMTIPPLIIAACRSNTSSTCTIGRGRPPVASTSGNPTKMNAMSSRRRELGSYSHSHSHSHMYRGGRNKSSINGVDVGGRSGISPGPSTQRMSMDDGDTADALLAARADDPLDRGEDEKAAYHPRAGETDHNPSQSVLVPGGGPTILLDDPPSHVYEKAIGRTLAWVGGALIFAAGLFATAGPVTAEEFVAGYLVEQSLSVDNLFVFLLLFDYFKVPLAFQDRVLNWGIYGAIVMRAFLIGVGAAALRQFHAILLVFAAILVYSSANVLVGGEEGDEEDMSENAIVKLSRKLIDSSEEYDGDRFFTIVDGAKKATPLFICMIAVEISDVVFAVDSIPAVFGVTENPIVVFTSNMFAIMGLRSLYTILSKAASDLEYLEPAVAVVLGFIGSKMIAEYVGYEIATETALAFVATILVGGVGLSIWAKSNREKESATK